MYSGVGCILKHSSPSFILLTPPPPPLFSLASSPLSPFSSRYPPSIPSPFPSSFPSPLFAPLFPPLPIPLPPLSSLARSLPSLLLRRSLKVTGPSRRTTWLCVWGKEGGEREGGVGTRMEGGGSEGALGLVHRMGLVCCRTQNGEDCRLLFIHDPFANSRLVAASHLSQSSGDCSFCPRGRRTSRSRAST
jgi:hypothetical protein